MYMRVGERILHDDTTIVASKTAKDKSYAPYQRLLNSQSETLSATSGKCTHSQMTVRAIAELTG